MFFNKRLKCLNFLIKMLTLMFSELRLKILSQKLIITMLIWKFSILIFQYETILYMYRRSIGRKIGINVLVFISKKKKTSAFCFFIFWKSQRNIKVYSQRMDQATKKKKKFSDYKMNYLKLSHQLNGNMIM